MGAANVKSSDRDGKPIRYVEEDDSTVSNGTNISMELDTGATVSVISEEAYMHGTKHFPRCNLKTLS